MYNNVKTPSANVTVEKQRIKQFDVKTSKFVLGGANTGTVYLEDNTEFEIELFNPSQSRVVAEITLNGEKLSGGVVLRPGDRVFLDRFLNENRKFLFSTYSVEDSEEVSHAIAMNGIVEVRFYNEKVEPKTLGWNTWRSVWNNSDYVLLGNGSHHFISNGNTDLRRITPNSLNVSNNNFVSPNTLGGVLGTSFPPSFPPTSTTGDYVPLGLGSVSTYKSEVGTAQTSFDTSSVLRSQPTKKSKSIETGRVEKGGISNQSFRTVDLKFEDTPVSSYKWKIEPKSKEVLTKEDLVFYCTECGSKKKKDSHKFCPHCGNKF